MESKKLKKNSISINNTYGFPLPIDVKIIAESKKILYGFDKKLIEYIHGYPIRRHSPTHIHPQEHAIDIAVPIKTPIIAVAAGEIVSMNESSSEYGASKDYIQSVNFITIKHDNNKFSQYLHLGLNSISKYNLDIGDYVSAGDVIGETGNSGFMSHPHLHFVIFKESNNTFGYKSIKIYF